MDRFFLCSLLFAVCVCWNTVHAQTVLKIGTPDAYAKEFKIFRNLGDSSHKHTRHYVEKERPFRDVDGCKDFFADEKNLTFTVGQSQDKDWPFVHPVGNCPWAGVDKTPVILKVNFKVDFPCDNPEKPFYLKIGLIDSGIHHNGHFDVVLNGEVIGKPRHVAQIPHGTLSFGAGAAYHPESWGRPRGTVLTIPYKKFKSGGEINTLEIQPVRVDDNAQYPQWFVYDYIVWDDQPELPVIPDYSLQLLDQAIEAMGTEEVVFNIRSMNRDPHWFMSFGKTILVDTGIPQIDKNFDREVFSRMGGKLVVYNLRTGAYRYLIDDPLGSVRDARVHYSGEKILFSYRPGTTDFFQLYEIDVDGTNLRKLPMAGNWDDTEPCYLPNDDIVYCSSRHHKYVQCGLAPVANLNRYFYADNMIREFVANPDSDNFPGVLKDGRIIYMKWDYNHRSQLSFHHLWTLNPDGSADTIFFGNAKPGGVFLAPKPVPDENAVVFKISPYHGESWDCAGYVAKVGTDSDPSDFHALQYISGDWGPRFFDPYPLKNGLILTSVKDRIVVMNSSGQMFSDFKLPDDLLTSDEEVYTVTLRGDQLRCNMLIRDVQPLAPRPRETVIPDAADYAQKTAVVSLQDVYTGRQMQDVPRGSIKKLMVTEMLPAPSHYHGGTWPISPNGGFALERIWGYVDVEEDGSALFELPSGKAMAFTALDENGVNVKRMMSFVGLAPGTMTSCIGCHENRTQSPVQKGLPDSYKTGVQKLKDFGGRKSPFVVDYVRDIQPLLDKYCVKCHNDEDYAGGIELSHAVAPFWFMSYFNLKPFKNQMVDGSNEWGMMRPYTFGSGGSPIYQKAMGKHNNEKFSDDDLETLRLWLDTGSFMVATYGSGSTTFINQAFFDVPRYTPEMEFPEYKGLTDVLGNRCAECHKGKSALPRTVGHGPISAPTPNGEARWTPFNTQNVYNFTRPERSAILRFPLDKAQGGLATEGKHPIVFTDTNDPDYVKMLAFIQACRNYLDTHSPPHTAPNFMPGKGYIHNLKMAGVLDPSLPLNTPLPAFETDEKYFQWIEDTMSITPPEQR